jgi:subtilisin family serine protease
MVRVIVGFDTAFAPVGRLGASQQQSQERAIANAGDRVLNIMAGLNHRLKNRYRHIPYMAMSLDRNALEALASSPLVRTIEEDRTARPAMASSNQVIGSPLAWAEGLDGSGWAVAVLDTGVDSSHPWFSGKVVSEACYGTNDTNVESFCPGGATSSTAPDSGLHCIGATGCDHGTHVAGTVAGNDGIGPDYGVARGADLVAMQVFSKFTDAGDCGDDPAPCVRSSTSDQIAALERVLELADTIDIAAVNMSLGGGAFANQAACDAANGSIKAAIDNLRSLDIASVIATGNDDYRDAIGAPGCVSTAVSVGATTDGDAVASFSNIYPEIHLLAPGVSINSALPGGGTGIKQGTSMATPHVAGAWAVMKQRTPGASVADVLADLQATATPVDDQRTGGIESGMPRINLDLAIGTPRTTFGIFNHGPGTLTVTALALETPADWIGWSAPATPFDVPAGELEVVEIDVDYGQAPEGQSFRTLNVGSNDPDESIVGVIIEVNAQGGQGEDLIFKDGFETP